MLLQHFRVSTWVNVHDAELTPSDRADEDIYFVSDRRGHRGFITRRELAPVLFQTWLPKRRRGEAPRAAAGRVERVA